MPIRDEPYVLGISASHNGSVCLLKGDRIVAAIQEERLQRVKRATISGSRPSLALSYCLETAGIQPKDLAMVVSCVQGRARSARHDLALNPMLRVHEYGIPTRFISHHLGHAISAFATSGFSEAAVLVIDGSGSPYEDLSPAEQAVVLDRVEDGWETISLYAASGTQITPLEKHLVARGLWLDRSAPGMARFGSLGGLYGAATRYIFGDASEAGKVMGLAAYGRPAFPPELFFSVVDRGFVFHDEVPRRFPEPRRSREITADLEDLACSTQAALERAVLGLARGLRELCPVDNLCYAGGVALNGPANEAVLRDRGFARMYVIPAAEDSGAAIGAAYHGLWQLTGKHVPRSLGHDALGREYPPEIVSAAVARTPGIEVVATRDLLDEVTTQLIEQKLVGWFQGRSELGPRALGQRSILCDPRRPDAKDTLNRRIKHREGYRPFAPAILLSHMPAWFELDGTAPESPYMLRVCQFQPHAHARVPAVVHADGTGRPQTVTPADNGRFHALIQRFHERTGVPMLLNTSFNIVDEPIVETPEDALWCFLSTGLDLCVLGDTLVTRAEALRSILDLTPRVCAITCRRDVPIVDGALARSPARAGAFFLVRTPWGEVDQWIEGDDLVIVAAIDGRKTGRDLRESRSEDAMLLALARLRRLRIIALDPADHDLSVTRAP